MLSADYPFKSVLELHAVAGILHADGGLASFEVIRVFNLTNIFGNTLKL
jgi:hypothetical protein